MTDTTQRIIDSLIVQAIDLRLLLVIYSAIRKAIAPCVLLLVFAAPVSSFAKEPPVLILRSLGGDGMEGGHFKGYLFEIYKGGFVHYYGESNVKVLGNRSARITPYQVQQLIATYKAIDNVFNHFKELGRENEMSVNHKPYYSFQLQYQGERSEIYPFGFANEMFINLNKMIHVKDWICFPKDDRLCPLKPLSSSIYQID